MRTAIPLVALLLALAAVPAAWAHAFPKTSVPHVGATVASAPSEVKIWFDGELEPVFSTLIVKNVDGKQVSTGKGQVATNNHALLETALNQAISAGQYTVYWSVIAHDGHHTEGHYAFTVK